MHLIQCICLFPPPYLHVARQRSVRHVVFSEAALKRHSAVTEFFVVLPMHNRCSGFDAPLVVLVHQVFSIFEASAVVAWSFVLCVTLSIFEVGAVVTWSFVFLYVTLACIKGLITYCIRFCNSICTTQMKFLCFFLSEKIFTRFSEWYVDDRCPLYLSFSDVRLSVLTLTA
jgi:hypothetical protein